ncbi:MAG: type II toxin-antitoxin system HicA family toxin [Rickettsiales bacterium]|jgi:predicted RNA binding protein YcfA (HicA-like mRNA interferase family)|nr:type II toxin-antitoxin system HicA family toxin [Rickettsiales bacterium]
MKTYSSKELIDMIAKDGWYEVNCKGSHHQFRHPVKTGKVTVPHPKKDMDPKTAKSILIQAGLK